jgi:hypothetical protein
MPSINSVPSAGRTVSAVSCELSACPSPIATTLKPVRPRAMNGFDVALVRDAADDASKVKIANLLRITHLDEVEPPVTDWLREAYEWEDKKKVKSKKLKVKKR